MPGQAAAKPSLPPLLNIIAIATFAASLSSRALDPVLPHVAEEFGVSIATAAGLSAAVAFTFAIIQPVLGAAADLFGKARLVIACLVLLGLANMVGALATSYGAAVREPHRLRHRRRRGIPDRAGLASDMVAPDKRQVAIGRLLFGAMAGNLLGASASGVIGDFLGWRGVLAVLGVLVIAASLAVAIGFRGVALKQPATRMDLATLRQGYRIIFANPNAKLCFAAVFIEGCCVLGLLPYVAAFLFELGEERLSIAGLVIAGFAVGGLFYTLSVSQLLPRLGVRGMMIAGAAIVASQLVLVGFGPRWPVQLVAFVAMGWGFYMLHGCLQVFASELSETARASALSLHSFFFFAGQTVGPIAYGFGVAHAGKQPTMIAAASMMMALGLVCARFLRQIKPADAMSDPAR